MFEISKRARRLTSDEKIRYFEDGYAKNLPFMLKFTQIYLNLRLTV